MSTHPLWLPYDQPDDAAIAAARVAPHVPAPVEVVEPDPGWPGEFEVVRARIVAALAERARVIEHVGSTSVPGLAAKDLIDVDVLVDDSADEAAYLPDLEDAGFRLRVREPDWEEHRLVHGTDPDANVHIFTVGAVEPARHRLFRDWLRTHDVDREAYAKAKQAAAAQGFSDSMHYNNAKSGFVYDLYEAIFAADPDHPHDPQPRDPQPRDRE